MGTDWQDALEQAHADVARLSERVEVLAGLLREAQEWMEEHPPGCQCDSGDVESATCPHYEFGTLQARIRAALEGQHQPAKREQP